MNDRISQFLDDADLTREEILYFYDQVNQSHQDLGKRVSRDVAALALLAVLFGLLATQDLSEVEVFGVKLSAFFAQFEPQKIGRHRITPGFEDWELALDEIIKRRDVDDLTAIRIMLQRLSGRDLSEARASPALTR